MRICVISPSMTGRYTMALVWGLAKDGHQVDSVIVRRMLSLARARHEWSQGPSRLLVKIIRRGMQVDTAEARESTESLRAHCARLGVPDGDVRTVCKAVGARVVWCQALDEPSVSAHLAASKPDLVFFAGGGMVRKPVLDVAGRGVVNCHIGPLPAFRGMDVIEWPALLGVPLGITCHFMDEGLDTGPILLRRPLKTRPGDTFDALRMRVEPLMVESMREVARLASRAELRPEPQAVLSGRQYFALHPRLTQVAERRLAARSVSHG